MKNCILFVSIVIGTIWGSAKCDVIQGNVTDADDGTPIQLVKITLESNPACVAYSDSSGAYRLDTDVSGIDGSPSITWHPGTNSFSWGPYNGTVTIQARNAKGVCIDSYSSKENKNQDPFTLARYPEGLYFITITTRHHRFCYKVLKVGRYTSTSLLKSTVHQTTHSSSHTATALTPRDITLQYEKYDYQSVNKTVPNGNQSDVDITMKREDIAILKNGILEVQFIRATEKISLTSLSSNKTFVTTADLSEKNGSAKIIDVPGHVLGDGMAIEVSFSNGNKDRIFLFPDMPFALFQKELMNKTSSDVTHDKLQTVIATLDLSTAANQLKCNGTAGIQNVNGHPGSYSYLSIVNPSTRTGLVAAWLTEIRGSGIVLSGIESDKAVVTGQVEWGKLRVKPNQSALGEIFALGYFEDARLGLERMATYVADLYGKTIKPCPTVYCTWYADVGGEGTEAQMESTAEWLNANLVPYGFSVAQIDDGWQVSRRTFNDYNHSGSYPSGMKPTADNIRNNNLTAGLWWMLSNDGSLPEEWILEVPGNAGNVENSSWAMTSMDPSLPAVKDYIRTCANLIANTWGYKYHKIDGMFTWMGARQNYINDGYKEDATFFNAVFSDPYKTNLDVYRDAWGIVRETVGENTFIMGCTISQNMRTMGGSFGIMDALRIGPDNKPDWNTLMRGIIRGGQRYFYNGRVFWVDPDPVYVRIGDAGAKNVCSYVAITGFMNTTSEKYETLTPTQVNYIKRTIPHHGLLSVRPADYYDRDNPGIWLLTDTTKNVRRDVIGIFNFDSTTGMVENYSLEKLGLSGTETYVGFDFWADKFVAPFQTTLSFVIPPKGCQVIAVRPVSNNPMVISTNRHVTQGIVSIKEEIWDGGSNTLSGKSDVVGNDPYELRIVAVKSQDIWTAKTVSVSSEDQAAGVTVDPITQNSSEIRVTIKSPANRQVAWSIIFE